MKVPTGARSVLTAILIGLWLPGCGGGGSGAEASTGGPITNPTSPPPTNDFVVYEDISSNELLKGTLDSSSWKTLASYRRGQDALSRLASGQQLVVYRSASSQNDAITIYDVVSGQVLITQEIPKNTVVAGPLFGNADQYLLRTYVGASDDGKAFIVNLKAGNVLATINSGNFDATIDALPDGRLYRINSKTGVISTSGADGLWSDTGRLSIPAGTTLGIWRVNHQGNKIAVVYKWFEGAASHSDVWIAAIDGSSPSRLTNQGYMGNPVWSPDDSKVAFNYDTSSSLAGGGTGVTGRCTYWQVPATAQNVTGISVDQQHAVAAQMRVSLRGVKNYSPCNIIAWER